MKLRRNHPAPRRRDNRSRRWGITLLDVLLVVVIASILAVVGVPMMGSALVDFRLSSTALEIAAAIEYAQATALANGCGTLVRFNDLEQKVKVKMEIAGSNLALTPGDELAESVIETTTFELVEHPVNRGTDYVLALGSQVWAGEVGFKDADFGGAARVQFDARGTPVAGGTVTLVSDGRELVLAVDAQSGRVTTP